ncbi:N-terminal cleavage protein [Opitutaceae bacterium TAV5]|nr:N-terminal cleavage protein [Opitutaceae bacterium TAV5]
MVRFTCPRPRAFTLIELLTVIAIIGILAAIIIPVVGKVRETARKTRCLSATRQIGIAFLAYAGDHKDALPVQTASSVNTDPQSWVYQISPYTNGYAVFACSEYRAKKGDPIPTAHRLYNGFVSRKQIPANPAPTRITQSSAPGRDVLMTEQNVSASLDSSSIIDWPNDPKVWWHYPHSGKGTPVDATRPDNVTRCVLYVDGHVNQRPANITNENWTWPANN